MKNTKNISDTHPRLYFNIDDINEVKKQLVNNTQMQEWLKILEQSAEDLLTMEFYTEEHANSVYDQHGKFYEVRAQIIKIAHTLGFLYQITGKFEYASKVKDAMLFFASFKSWAGPSNKDRETPWKSELNTAHILENFAFAWDCIYDTLTQDDKKIISDGMLSNGILPLMEDWVLPGTRVHALDSMGHNWWAVCVGLAGVGICAIYEYIPQADEWLRQINDALQGFIDYGGELLLNKTPNFDDKGLFYESQGYANYGIGETAHFQYVYSRCFGHFVSYAPDMMQVMTRAFNSFAYPISNAANPYAFANFGDSGYFGTHIQMPLYFTLMNDGSINEADAFILREIYKMSRSRAKEMTALDFVYYDKLWNDNTADLSDLPLNAVHENGGCAVLRSSWEKDGLFFAVRCGYTWNHAHEDGGSFILYDKGVPLLTDSGAYQYGNPMHRGYNLSARGHNVVIANGTGQFSENLYRGTKYPGTLSHFMENDWCAYLLADATGPLCDRYQRNYRSFIRLYGDCFLILDEIRTYQPSTFEWLLHYAGDVQINDGGREIIVVNGEARAKISSIFPSHIAVEKKDVYSTAYIGKTDAKYCSYLSITKPDGLPDREALFLTLVTTDTSITAQPIKSVDCIGTEFIRNNIKIEMYYNLRSDGQNMHVNTTNKLGVYETDAYILVKTTEMETEKTRYLIVYGSYLRKNGVSIYENYAKKFVFI